MHVPDGFIDGATSAATVAVAAGSIGVALKRVGPRFLEERLPLAGLTAAFVFAAQMVNFPVAGGTSGHLLGGGLAVVLVGPAAAVVIMSAVLVVQTLLFADGGLTAIGVNILNLAVLAPLAAWLLNDLVSFAGGRRRAVVIPATAAAAWGSVVVAAAGFSALYAIGGHGDVPTTTVFGAMVGVHALIGVGEAIITVVVVRAVLSARPDLVWAAERLDGRRTEQTRRPLGRALGAAAIASVLIVAVGVSQLSSGDPDGLERVAIDTGFESSARDHALGDQVLADYGQGFADERTGTAASGLIGTAVTLAVAVGALLVGGRLLRARSEAPQHRLAPSASVRSADRA